jgi:hypothetical protein
LQTIRADAPIEETPKIAKALSGKIINFMEVLMSLFSLFVADPTEPDLPGQCSEDVLGNQLTTASKSLCSDQAGRGGRGLVQAGNRDVAQLGVGRQIDRRREHWRKPVGNVEMYVKAPEVAVRLACISSISTFGNPSRPLHV